MNALCNVDIHHPPMNSTQTRTPQQRLAETRVAIEQQMSSGGRAPDATHAGIRSNAGASSNNGHASVHPVWTAAQAWWRKQPASIAIELAEPILGVYARKHPLLLVSIAASIGVVIAATRPWRLLSGKRLLWLAASSAGLPALLQSNRTQNRRRISDDY